MSLKLFPVFGDSVNTDEAETSTEAELLGDADEIKLGSGVALPKLSDPCGDREDDGVELTSGDAVTNMLLDASTTLFETNGVELTNDVAEIVHNADEETLEDGDAGVVGVRRELGVTVVLAFDDTEAATDAVSTADTSAVADDEKQALGVELSREETEGTCEESALPLGRPVGSSEGDVSGEPEYSADAEV